MEIHNLLKKWWRLGAVLILGFIGALFWLPLTPIFGSWAGFFSPKAFLVPLVGAFGGIWASFLIAGIRLFVRSLWGLGLLFDAHLLAHYLPGLCASLSWATRSLLIHLFLPILCMFLFMAHPVGSHVWYYSLYWFIPVGVYVWRSGFESRGLKGTGDIFFQSLGSTFIAHAVGSVIWLYTVPMSASQWQALIPVVALERLVFAACMMASYVIIAYAVPQFRAGSLLGKKLLGASRD